jgi:hypothetical protein
MQSMAPGASSGIFKTRNFLFFVAVLLMHWTLPRPAPGDLVFLAALLPSILINPRVNMRAIVFLLLILAWAFSIVFSSIDFLDDPAVRFQLFAHGFVITLAITSCLVALSWGERDFHTFMKVYLIACCISATLGIVGFAGHIPLFLWDDRAKGLFDEPIAFGGFLLPGVFAAMYMLSYRRGLAFPAVALVLCIAGVVLSFSRADIVALIVFAPLYFLVLNRHQLSRAIAVLLIGAFLVVVLTGIAFVSFEGFQDKLMSRLTVAEPYDLGRMGRYNRYVLAIPLILDHPFGLGMLQIDKIFPEPIHNVFISSFVNYGWLAGMAWLLLILLSVKIAAQNQRATGSPVAVWLSFSLAAQLPCALLQQVEHWRHLWMLMGLLWGFKIANFVRQPLPMHQGPHTPPQQVWVAPPPMQPAHQAAYRQWQQRR